MIEKLVIGTDKRWRIVAIFLASFSIAFAVAYAVLYGTTISKFLSSLFGSYVFMIIPAITLLVTMHINKNNPKILLIPVYAAAAVYFQSFIYSCVTDGFQVVNFIHFIIFWLFAFVFTLFVFSIFDKKTSFIIGAVMTSATFLFEIIYRIVCISIDMSRLPKAYYDYYFYMENYTSSEIDQKISEAMAVEIRYFVATIMMAFVFALFMAAVCIVMFNSENISIAVEDKEFFRVSRRLIPLWIFSCIVTGVLTCVWSANLVVNIKKANEDCSKSVSEVICLLLVPFYNLYWAYTRGNTLTRIGKKYNLPFNSNGVLYLVLNFFGLSVITVALMQNDLNMYAKAQRNGELHEVRRTNHTEADLVNDFADDIIKLHSMKEKTILTDEEFADKKAELLKKI